jgi:hypothetical protein
MNEGLAEIPACSALAAADPIPDAGSAPASVDWPAMGGKIALNAANPTNNKSMRHRPSTCPKVVRSSMSHLLAACGARGHTGNPTGHRTRLGGRFQLPIPLLPGCSDQAQQWKHESPHRGDWLVGSAVFCQNARFALPAPWTVPHRRTFLVSSLYHRGSSRTSLGFRCWPQGKTGQALDTMWYNQGTAVVPGQTLFSTVRIRNVRPFCRGGHSSTRRKRE